MSAVLRLAVVLLAPAVLVTACSGEPSAAPSGAATATGAATAGPGGATPSPSSPAASSPAASSPSVSGPPVVADSAALLDAAWADDVEQARRLIAAGADVNAQDDTQQSAFLVAASEGYLDLLELTLASGADVRALDSFRGTALIRAAERGHANVVGRLVRAGVAVDHVNRLGWTALHEAILLGDGDAAALDTVRALVAGRADVTVRTVRDGRTPLTLARDRGFAAAVPVLEAAQAAQPVRDPDAALLAAAAAGDADAVALAVRAGADLEARDGRRRTALLLASAADRVPVARLLVALGADPDALDDRHDTPWLVTGVTGSVAMLETLLPVHPDLRIRNRFGGLSVIPASERGHVEYVRRVVTTGIDVNHVNDLGWTALLEAVILGDGSRRYQEIVQLLLAAGADRSIPDKDGVTALQHARRRGLDAVARLLATG